MILDQLIEKKDLLAYIEFRIKYLLQEEKVENYPEKEREFYRKKLQGRVNELKKLRAVVSRGNLKKSSKIYYSKVER